MPVEFQRKRDPKMPLRRTHYVILAPRDLDRQGRLDPDGRLPPVRPVVLYNGLRPWRGPTSLADLSADGSPECPRSAQSFAKRNSDANRRSEVNCRQLVDLTSF